MSEDGEIAPLDADPLSAGIEHEDQIFSDDPDEKALARIASRLRLRGGRSEEQIEELSAEIYNTVCSRVRAGQLSAKQLRAAAELLGESPQDLRDRLQ